MAFEVTEAGKSPFMEGGKADEHVTRAALVMVLVFAAFAASRVMFFQQIGVGLGVAILIDATIIRAILLPASMKLLGDLNWYLPNWLEWLTQDLGGG